jgi:hypothetical protein
LKNIIHGFFLKTKFGKKYNFYKTIKGGGNTPPFLIKKPMENKNFGLVYGKDNNNQILALNTSRISTFKLVSNNDTHYLIICCGIVDHVFIVKSDNIKTLMLKLSVFMLNPSEFDNMFFLNIKSEEIFGVDLENE